MTATIRQPSKTMATANRTIFSRHETIPAVFSIETPADRQLCGFMRVQSRALWLAGIEVNFREPPGSRHTFLEFSFQNGNGTPVPGVILPVLGVQTGKLLPIQPNVALPVGTTWMTQIHLGDERDYLPRGVELTYYVRFAQGAGIAPVSLSNSFVGSGIGFMTIEDNFVVF